MGKDLYMNNNISLIAKWMCSENASSEQTKRYAQMLRKGLVELQKQFADETIIVVTHGQFARNLIAAHFNCNYHEVAPFVNAEIRMLNI